MGESPITQHLLQDISRLGWSLLRRFSVMYKPADVIAALAGLSNEEFERLRALHFLNSEAASEFVYRAVPSFMRSMPMATELAVREDRSYPRGAIDWIRTTAARQRHAGDPSIFISRSPQRSRNTAVAKLFAYLLNDIVRSSSGLLKGPLPEVARAKIEEVAALALRHLAGLEARGVSTPRSMRTSDVAHLRRSPKTDVRHALNLLQLRKALFQDGGEKTLLEIMSQGLFAPENLDDLFECWSLLQVVEAHVRTGWAVSKARLVGGEGRKYPHFNLTRGMEKVALFYQIVPAPLSLSSAYKTIFDGYSIDVSLRRPDIVALVEAHKYSGPMIIEVKRTENREYIVDSVYKTIGYIADYQVHFGSSKPNAVIVVIGGIDAPDPFPSDADVWIAPADRVRTLQLPY